MAKLDGLKKLQQWELDQRRQELAELISKQTKLETQLAALEQQILDEQKFATENPDYIFSYPEFGKGAIQKREALRYAIKEAEVEVQSGRDAVAAAYEEVKKTDITQERAEEKKRLEEDRKETQILDDIGADQFRRREE